MAKKSKTTNNNSFLRDMIREIGDINTFIADDGMHSSEFTGSIDTGSYILNGILSGSIYGGVPNNKIVAFAGESATGKTFFVLGLVKKFLDDNPLAGVIYYDTEAAVTKQMMLDRGIDTRRVVISEQNTIEEFRTHAMRTLDRYLTIEEDDRPPLMFVLDSLGMLSTGKEVHDISTDKRNEKGEATKDMTRPGLIRGSFRALSLRLAKARAPMLVTNHTYDKIGTMYPEKEMSGGSGLKYAASQIVFLSKKKDKDGKDVIGNIIHCKMYKSRLTKENKMVDVKLSYANGLDRYYGLLELAEKYEIIKKVSTQYQLPDGTKVFGKKINENPEIVFTKEILDKLDEAAAKEFRYGTEGAESDETSDESTEAA